MCYVYPSQAEKNAQTFVSALNIYQTPPLRKCGIRTIGDAALHSTWVNRYGKEFTFLTVAFRRNRDHLFLIFTSLRPSTTITVPSSQEDCGRHNATAVSLTKHCGAAIDVPRLHVQAAGTPSLWSGVIVRSAAKPGLVHARPAAVSSFFPPADQLSTTYTAC